MPGYTVATRPVVTGGHLQNRKVVLSNYQMLDGDIFVSLLKGNRELGRLIGLPLRTMYKTTLHVQLRELRNKQLDKLADIAEGVADDMDIGLGDDDDIDDKPKRKRTKRAFNNIPPVIDVSCPSIDGEGEDVVIKMMSNRNYKAACMLMLNDATIEYLVKRVKKDIDEYDDAERDANRGSSSHRPIGIVLQKSRPAVLCRWKVGKKVKTKSFPYISPDEQRQSELQAHEFMAQIELPEST